MFSKREKVKCLVCFRNIPVEDGLLIPHRYNNSFFALYDLKCHGSGSMASVHVDLRQQVEQEIKDVEELY